jgi:DNA repair ATPase RecN
MVEKVGMDQEGVYIEFEPEDEIAGDVNAVSELLKLIAESIASIYSAIISIAMTRALYDHDIEYIHSEIKYIQSKLNEVTEIVKKWAKKLGLKPNTTKWWRDGDDVHAKLGHSASMA